VAGSVYAESCKIDDPDRYIESVFWDSVGYKPNFLKALEEYNIGLLKTEKDEDYSIYEVYNRDKKIEGYVLCVNQTYYSHKNMQLVIALDKKRTIRNIFYKRLNVESADLFTGDFINQFLTKNIKNIDKEKFRDYSQTEEDKEIYFKTIFAVKKGLFLLDLFI
jgi:hypothetical protein